MMHSLVEKYRMGMITDDHLVMESFYRIDTDNPGLVLSCLPDNILQRMLWVANEYLPGKLVTNYGVLPTQEQVLAARHWIEKSFQQTAAKTA